MPLALSFMLALLFAGGGAGTDLIVGAVAAGLIAGRGFEMAHTDPGRRGLDGLAGFRELAFRGHMPAREARLQEPQLDAGGQPPRHFLLGERVHLELEALACAPVRRLLLGDVARLVVDDHRAEERVVDAIEPPAHAGGAEREAELALDVRGPLP